MSKMNKEWMKRERIKFVVALIFFLIIGFAYALNQEEAEYPAYPETSVAAPVTPGEVQRITPSQAQAMMESGEPYILLDVRTEGEFDREHIPGALLFPYGEIDLRAPLELTDLEARILLYCQTGRRSAEAAAALARLGYQNVYDFGGINAWPYETVRG